MVPRGVRLWRCRGPSATSLGAKAPSLCETLEAVTLNRPCVRRASAAAASRSCRRCSMDVTCAPSNRRPRLLKTCGSAGSDPQSTVRTVGAARRRRACLQAGSLLGCVRSTTARCVVSCAGSRSSMERCPRRFASTAALHTALSDELSTAYGCWMARSQQLLERSDYSFTPLRPQRTQRLRGHWPCENTAAGTVGMPRAEHELCPPTTDYTAFERCAVSAATSVDHPARSG